MFSRSRNLLITGGTYTDNRVENHSHEVAKVRGIDVLLDASAPSAFHNSGERFDPPKCHPRTRIHILTKIMNWVVGEVGWDGFIMWLYGPAGAGKSAIAQTVAEQCHARHLLLASFFFSRTDPKRNHAKCLIASIAYQIALNLPEAKDAIEAVVDRNPATFQCSVKAQLTTLILEPLTQLSQAGSFHSTSVPYLIILDGLDECHERQVQQHILYAISSSLQQLEPSVHLRFLICSRAEPHLTPEFTSLSSEGVATHLSLNDGYEQDADIEQYLMDSFHKISTTHPLKEYIPPAWPTHKVLSTLVKKSSGQFIYAATVVKYISSTRHQPTRRLEIVLGMQPPRNDQPFAELDSLYVSLLSSVKDVQATLRLLGVLILTDLSPKTPEVVDEFMFLDPGEVQCLLLDLASVVECVGKDTPIRILHASFPDFLFDQSRSQEHYIDSSMMHAEIAQLCLAHVRLHDEACGLCPIPTPEIMCRPRMHYAYHFIVDHLSEAEPYADLREALLNTCYITSLIKFEQAGFHSWQMGDLLAKFLSFLIRSKFTDREELYLHHRNIWDRIIYTKLACFPLDLGSIVCLVLLDMMAHNSNMTSYFPTVEVGIVRNYSTLYFDPMGNFILNDDYHMLLEEFFTDPARAGTYVIDGPKYALVARFLLDCFIEPCPEQRFLDYLSHYSCKVLLYRIETLLSKASHSDALVARINHTNLVLNCSPRRHGDLEIDEGSVCALIQGIGEYLIEVIGSVPIGLQILAPRQGFKKRFPFVP